MAGTMTVLSFDPVWGNEYMQPFMWLVIIALFLSAGVGFAMGSNDVANSFGTSVGARVLSLAQACILAGVFNFIGAVGFGGAVTDTIRHGIVELDPFEKAPHVYMAAMAAAYIGTFGLVMASTFLGMPVSTTHAVVGGILGTSLCAFGNNGVNWMEFGNVIIGWFAAPLFAGLIAAGFYLLQKKLVLHEKDIFRALKKQRWFASFQLGLIFWTLCFFLLTKVVNDDLPDSLKITKLGDDKPATWPGSLLLPLVCFAVMFFVVVLSYFIIMPAMFRAIERDSNFDAAKVERMSETNSDAVKDIEKSVPADSIEETSDKKETWCEALFTLNHEGKRDDLDQHKDEDAAAFHDAADEYPEQLELRFKGIQVISASFMALSHGANDISNVVGPLAGIVQTWNDGILKAKAQTNYGLLSFGGLFIVIGLATLGAKVMATIGHNTTKITPSRGVNIEIGAAFAVTVASYLGIPTSSTQCAVGAIVAVGLCNKGGSKAVNFKLFGKMFLSWVLTPLVSGLIAAAFFELFNVVVVNQVPEDFFPLITSGQNVYLYVQADNFTQV